MSKTYSVVVRLTLDRPIEEFGRRDLKKYIRTAIRRWGKSLHPDDIYFDGILNVELDQFKDVDISAARSRAGKARAQSLTADERSEISRRAATARWEKAHKNK